MASPEKRYIWIDDHRNRHIPLDDYTARIRRQERNIARDHYRATNDFTLLNWWSRLDEETVIEVCPVCGHSLLNSCIDYVCPNCSRVFSYEKIEKFTKDLFAGMRWRENWNRRVAAFNRDHQLPTNNNIQE